MLKKSVKKMKTKKNPIKKKKATKKPVKKKKTQKKKVKEQRWSTHFTWEVGRLLCGTARESFKRLEFKIRDVCPDVAFSLYESRGWIERTFECSISNANEQSQHYFNQFCDWARSIEG